MTELSDVMKGVMKMNDGSKVSGGLTSLELFKVKATFMLHDTVLSLSSVIHFSLTATLD